MTAPAFLRPQAFALATYAAFRLDDAGRAARIGIGDAATLDQALTAALPACIYKDRIAIRETDDDGTRLHVFMIRRRAPKWIHEPGEIVPRRVVDLYPEPVCVIDAGVLS